MASDERPHISLCLPGGGAPGAMFQIAALAALEHCLEGLTGSGFDSYVGTSSGASVAAALAAGQDVQRIYRAFLDPADDYFPLERRHILRMDLMEWRRTVQTGARALSHGSRSFWSSDRSPSPAALWEELARVYDSMPAGLFSLDGYERFLEDNFARRGVPNQFRAMPRPLRIVAHELDSGEPVVFGGAGYEHVPITRACIASMATPPLFSPVRIGNLHYLNPAPSQLCHVDVALGLGAQIVVVINPMVPLRVPPSAPGSGVRASVRDKGAMWVANQANRIKLRALLHSCVDRVRNQGLAKLVVIEPSSTDGTLFMHNPANFAARRAILEYSYLFTRELVTGWIRDGELPLMEARWNPIVADG